MSSHSQSRRTFLSRAASIAGAAALPVGRPLFAAGPTRRPNILFILADDMGYADLSCYGRRDYATPHLDRLAAQGTRLVQGYANSAVCSATRTALITGRYQYRLPIGLEEPEAPGSGLGIPADHPTLPSLLRARGYKTSLIGKWHLGGLPDHGPLNGGYDRFFGVYEGGADYFSHTLRMGGREIGGLFEGTTRIEKPGYMTEILADRAIEEIETAGRDRKPFFMSLHFTAPHWPWEGPGDAELAKTMSNSLDPAGGNIAKYGELVTSLDLHCGRILAALDKAGLTEDTIVVFTSDNGGERFSDTWPFIGAKTELLEGGLRVPLIIRWPGKIASGATSQQVMISMDFLPTLLAAAGGAADRRYPSDGVDLLPILTGAAQVQPRTLFWRYKAMEQAAMRSGDWKYLHINEQDYLFDLAQDQRERANRITLEPDRFAQMKDDYAKWNATMLPYRPGQYSHSAKTSDHWADRY